MTFKYYQLCPNDDPGLTFTIFMTGSDLFPNASAWEKAYIALSAHVFLNCSNSAYPQHSGDRYKIIGPIASVFLHYHLFGIRIFLVKFCFWANIPV